MISSFYRDNNQSLHWYASLTNTYHDELIRAAQLPPDQYNGVLFILTRPQQRIHNHF